MTDTQPKRSRSATFSLYLVIATLVAAAILGAVLIVVGDQANVAGRAWLTLVLVAAFAGAVALDSIAANGPNRWYLAASTILNVVLVAVGLNKLWNGWLQPSDTADPFVWIVQIWVFLLLVVLLRVALVVTQLYWHFFVARARIALTRASGIAALVLVWITALVLAIPLALPGADWPDWWWRLAGATSLVALVALVVPVVVRAFEPRPPKAPQAPQPIAVYDPRSGQYYVPESSTAAPAEPGPPAP